MAGFRHPFKELICISNAQLDDDVVDVRHGNGTSSSTDLPDGHLVNKITSQDLASLCSADVASSEHQASILTKNVSLEENNQALDDGVPDVNYGLRNTNTDDIDLGASSSGGDWADITQKIYEDMLEEKIFEDMLKEKIKFEALDPEASKQRVQKILEIVSQNGCHQIMDHKKRVQYLRDIAKHLLFESKDDAVHSGDNQEISKNDDTVAQNSSHYGTRNGYPVTSNDPSSVPSTSGLQENESIFPDDKITATVNPQGSSCLVDRDYVTIKEGKDMDICLTNVHRSDKIIILVKNKEGKCVDKPVNPCKKHTQDDRFPPNLDQEKRVFYISQKFSPSFDELNGHLSTHISLMEEHFEGESVCLNISFRCSNSCDKVFSRRWILQLVVMRGTENVYGNDFFVRVCGQPSRDHKKDLPGVNSSPIGKGQKRSAESQNADYIKKEKLPKTGHVLKVEMGNQEDKDLMTTFAVRMGCKVLSCSEDDDD